MIPARKSAFQIDLTVKKKNHALDYHSLSYITKGEWLSDPDAA